MTKINGLNISDASVRLGLYGAFGFKASALRDPNPYIRLYACRVLGFQKQHKFDTNDCIRFNACNVFGFEDFHLRDNNKYIRESAEKCIEIRNKYSFEEGMNMVKDVKGDLGEKQENNIYLRSVFGYIKEDIYNINPIIRGLGFSVFGYSEKSLEDNYNIIRLCSLYWFGFEEMIAEDRNYHINKIAKLCLSIYRLDGKDEVIGIYNRLDHWRG